MAWKKLIVNTKNGKDKIVHRDQICENNYYVYAQKKDWRHTLKLSKYLVDGISGNLFSCFIFSKIISFL